MDQLSGDLKKAQAEVRQQLGQIEKSASGQLGGMFSKANAGAEQFSSTVRGLGSIFLAGLFIEGAKTAAEFAAQVAKAGSEIQNLKARLSEVSGSTQAFDLVFESAQRLGVAVDDVTGVFSRFALAGKDLGLSTGEVQKLTDVVLQLGRISGASASELSAGAIQLGQSLASGRLNGEELQSVLENIPAVARVIADSLGVPVGRLKEMGAEGQLTADKVAQALLGAADKVGQRFAALPETLEQSQARWENAWTSLLATLDQKFQASGLVKNVRGFFAGAIESFTVGLGGGTATQQLDVYAGKLGEIRDRIKGLHDDIDRENSAPIKSFIDVKNAEDEIARLEGEAKQYEQAVQAIKQGLAAAKSTGPGLTPGYGPAAPQLSKEDTDDAERIRKAVDEQYRFNAAVKEYDALLAKGAIDQATRDKAVAQARKDILTDPAEARAKAAEAVTAEGKRKVDAVQRIEDAIAKIELGGQKASEDRATRRAAFIAEKLASLPGEPTEDQKKRAADNAGVVFDQAELRKQGEAYQKVYDELTRSLTKQSDPIKAAGDAAVAKLDPGDSTEHVKSIRDLAEGNERVRQSEKAKADAIQDASRYLDDAQTPLQAYVEAIDKINAAEAKAPELSSQAAAARVQALQDYRDAVADQGGLAGFGRDLTDDAADRMDVLGNSAAAVSDTFSDIRDAAVDSFMDASSAAEAFNKVLQNLERKALDIALDFALGAIQGAAGSYFAPAAPTTGTVTTGGSKTGTVTTPYVPPKAAKGLAFSNGRITTLAKGGVFGPRGGVFDGPTLIPLARGAALAGEAGDEAAVPLVRDKSGNLAVRQVAGGGGGGGEARVEFHLHDERKNGAKAETEERQGSSGGREIHTYIRDTVAQQIGRGDHDKAMAGRFGLSPSVRR